MKLCLHCGSDAVDDEWQCALCGWGPEILDGYPAFAPSLARANSAFSPRHYDLLSAVDRSHFWFRARAAIVAWVMRRYFRAPAAIMEIGCGVGGILSHIRATFPGTRLTGTDIHSAAFDYARSRVPDATLIQMDATVIPFSSEFDLIAVCDVLEHIPDDEAALSQLFRALRPGGGIVVTVPNDPRLWSAWDELSNHQRRYTRDELIGKVRAAGFAVERITATSSLTLPLLIIARNRHPPGTPCALSDELQVPLFVNAVLRLVMACENFALRIGLNFAHGGSLLLVAKRPLDEFVHRSAPLIRAASSEKA